MSCSTTKRRSRSSIETEDDADAARFGDRRSPTASEGSKRMRLRGGRGTPSQADLAGDEDEDVNSGSEASGDFSHGAASATAFSPGAIVRVKVENFVTYEKAEFFPGPNLNMVIGPNGTGKSSLVCAICLGLGYNPSVLGRATSVGEFVKHGKEKGVVEIELQKRPQDRANYVVKLEINREDNARQFYLGGRPISLSKLRPRIQALRIQIDNLCQFLPQDKVAEFAGLNSIDLLGKTLQAAAPEEMIQQRNELKEMFDRQKAVQRDLDTGAEQLRSYQTRQQGLQADVERLREREQIQKAVTDLEDSRVVANYNAQKNRFMELKEMRRRAQEQQRRLEQRCAPSLEAANLKQEYCNQVETVLKARERKYKEVELDVNNALQAVEAVNEKIQTIENKKSAAKQALDSKKKLVSKERAELTKLEAKHKNVVHFDGAEFNRQIRDKERLKREIEEEQKDLDAKKESVRERGRAKKHELKSIDEELKSLNSQEGQRLSHLRQIDPDTVTAYEWLQDNQAKFEKEVFGPPMLTCSLKDTRYSKHVQTLLQKDDFLCFTAQTKKDHQALTDQFSRNMNLSVSVRTIMTDLSSFRPPVSPETMGSLGLDGFALDFLEGPEPVLAMLCSEKRLHVNGVSLNEISDEQHQKIEDGDRITAYAVGNTSYRITRRREYGGGAMSKLTKVLQPGIYWADVPVDAAAKAALQQRRDETESEVKELLQKWQNMTTADTETLTKRLGEIQKQLDDIQKEKNSVQNDYNRWKSLPDKIEIQKKSIQRLLQDLRETKNNLSSIDASSDEVILEKAKLVLQHQTRLAALRDANQAIVEARMRHIEATSDVTALRERNSGIMEKLDAEREKVGELAREAERVKKLAQDAREAVEHLLERSNGDLDIERRDYLLNLAGNKSVEDLTEDIETEKAKLELIHDTDPNVMREFEDRAKLIENLETANNSRRNELEELHTGIQELKETWEPGLDAIIGKINDAFSYNFEQINCAGEVGVHKDEDFDKWAIEIKVKFRENETLQKLDQHRQSGGERAVSTIFYLMSLQSMAQSPFRVVDEINQGMDPRNERMVHERMVEIACREHTSQYFLITPKLLSGLKYDERMKVLCIASGQHMPEEGGKLDFSRCVKIKKRMLGLASA